jgi:hypothetical protein
MRHIGVDLHKTNFVVCFLNADETSRLETYPLNESGINRFTAQLAIGNTCSETWVIVLMVAPRAV